MSLNIDNLNFLCVCMYMDIEEKIFVSIVVLCLIIVT